MKQEMESTKKTWNTPELTTHGTVEGLTQQDQKLKELGSVDDFGITGISDPV